MRKFLIHAGLFFAIMLAGVIAVELMLLSRPNVYSYKQQYMDGHLNDIKTLIMGQSHFEEGIRPELLGDSIFNLAISGQNLIFTEQLAQRYIPQMKNLKTVLLPFAYGMGYRSIPNPKSPHTVDYSATYACMYYKYMHLHYRGFMDWVYWPETMHNKFDFIGRLTSTDRQKMIQCDSLGYIPLKLENRSKGWKIGHLPNVVDFTRRNEEFFQQMHTIATLCEQRGIRLVMIAIPWYESAHEEMTRHGVAEMQHVAQELMDAHANIEYHNYVFDKRFQADDFNDATHLSDFGAVKFTKILRHDLAL